MFLNKPLDSIQFAPTETPAALKPDRVQPKLGSIIVTLNVNMRWFIYRFSDDLYTWGERAGDLVTGLLDTQWFGSSESPFPVQRDEGWYLFVTHVGPESYHRTKVWFSQDPTDFGSDGDHVTTLFAHAAQVFEYDGRTWITNTGCIARAYGGDFPDELVGVEVAELTFHPPNA